ncbi:carbohydrate binding domain-containing protein [Acholeplasma equifetale]|uniref:carbohydrate binding domain-containing protein n=1 Tax=Acholeplasma equifetale TaxID=264634 RepID=UPI00047A507B|nr:carbohydrate binding domain-containing protein [Acholeplasma equifetale]
MKKFLIGLTLLATLLVLVACVGNEETRTKPVITGLAQTAEITEGESINILEGVTAMAHGDVDITDKIVITVDPSTATVVGGVVTPQEPGSYLVTLTATDPKDTTLKTTATLFLKVLENTVVEEVSRVTYDFNSISETAFKGFVSKEFGEEVDALTVENGELIYTPITSGNGDGDNQIFTLLNLTAGTTYTISLEAKATRNLTGVAFVINGKTPGTWDPYAGMWEQEVTTEYRTFTHTFAVDEDNEAAELMLNVGGQGDADYSVHISKLTIVANSNPQTETLVFTDITSAGDGWVYVNDAGQSTASVVEGKAVINITDPVASIWEQKLFHEPIQLEANKVYKLSYTIHATEQIRYEFIARTKSQQSDGRDENYIWSGPNLAKDETRVVTHTFTTNEIDINDFDMFFQLGGQSLATVITISDVNLVSYDGFSEDVIRFTGLPEGFASFENSPAEANLYVDTETGNLVYDVAVFGDTDWYNKVFLEDILFKDGSKYRVEFVAKASKTIQGFFAINPMGQWNPKVTAMFELTTTAQTFSYETPNLQSFDETIELLFQFGSFNTGEAVIYIDSITIIELA